jgi:hypothetical protein
VVYYCSAVYSSPAGLGRSFETAHPVCPFHKRIFGAYNELSCKNIGRNILDDSMIPQYAVLSAVYDCKEGPVTFQIAADGVLLASDMLQARTAEDALPARSGSRKGPLTEVRASVDSITYSTVTVRERFLPRAASEILGSKDNYSYRKPNCVLLVWGHPSPVRRKADREDNCGNGFMEPGKVFFGALKKRSGV